MRSVLYNNSVVKTVKSKVKKNLWLALQIYLPSDKLNQQMIKNYELLIMS